MSQCGKQDKNSAHSTHNNNNESKIAAGADTLLAYCHTHTHDQRAESKRKKTHLTRVQNKSRRKKRERRGKKERRFDLLTHTFVFDGYYLLFCHLNGNVRLERTDLVWPRKIGVPID